MFAERLGLKLVSLLLATLLWVVVGARESTEAEMTVRVVPMLDSVLVLAEEPPRLRAVVAGRAVDLVKLYASPLVLRRAIESDAPGTLTFDVVPMDVHVPPDLVEAIRVVELHPRRVTLRVARKGALEGAPSASGTP